MEYTARDKRKLNRGDRIVVHAPSEDSPVFHYHEMCGSIAGFDYDHDKRPMLHVYLDGRPGCTILFYPEELLHEV